MLKLNVIKPKPVIDQSWSINRIVTEAIPAGWEAVFKDALPELNDVSNILDEQEKLFGQYYPLKKDIFGIFDDVKLSEIKVVIIGQDPYHQSVVINGVAMPRAIGRSFSVREEDSIPSSLQNIYIELANTVRGFIAPDHGNLDDWTKQGVFLLNACLTVRPGTPGSHGDIWLGFVRKVFKAISEVNPQCIFMLWGKEAQKLVPIVGEKSIILEAAHPSGLSARRGFFGCNHFNLANETLIRQGKVAINWHIKNKAQRRMVGKEVKAPEYQEKRQLSPVNVTILPTILPQKPVVDNGTPLILGLPKITPLNNIALKNTVPNVPTMLPFIPPVAK